jgi:hypothetical protein
LNFAAKPFPAKIFTGYAYEKMKADQVTILTAKDKDE